MLVLRRGIWITPRAYAIKLLFLSVLLLKTPAATLVWNANTETNLAGYIVHYSSGINPTSVVDVGRTNSFSLTGLAPAALPYIIYATAYDSNGLESEPSVSVTYTNESLPSIPSAPAIIRQPASVSTNPGGSVTFSVEASGSGTLSYQWLKNGVPITSAGSASYQIASAQNGDAGSYTVRVSNSAGAVTSQAASLTVLTVSGGAPQIVTQPRSQTVAAGDPLTLTVQASGEAPMSYRWLRNGSIASETSSSPDLSIFAAQVSHSGNFTVEVSNRSGTTLSEPAIVTVVAAPVIVTQPASQSVEEGAALTLSVQAIGTGTLSYRWIRNGTYVTPAGSSGSTYTVVSAMSNDAGSYKVEVSNSVGLVASQTAIVTVGIKAPVINRQPTSVSTSLGGSVTFSVEASGSGTLSYQWLKNGGAITGAGSASYQIASAQTSDTGSYSVRVSNSGGSVTSQAATLSVSVAAPRIVTQPQSQNVIAGTAVTLTVEASGGAPLSYHWLKNGSYVSAASSSPNFSIPSIQASQAGNYTVEVSNSGGTILSEAAVVTVAAPPVIVTQSASQSVEEGSALTLSVQATGTGTLSYRWLRNGSYITAASSSDSTYTVASVTSSDAGSYTAEVSNSAGSVTSQSAVISVTLKAPVINRQPASVSINPGSTATFSVEASGSGTLSYQWLKNGVAISGAGSASYQIASAQTGDTGNYSVRVSNSGGSVTSQAATLLVSVVAPRIVTQPQDQSVPVGNSLTLTAQATGGTPLSYRWLKNGAYVSTASSSPDFAIASIQVSDAGNYTVEVSNSSGTIASEPAVVTVVAAPVIVTQPLSQSVEVGAKMTLSVEATGSGPLNYRWIRNGSYISAASSSGNTYSVTSITSGDGGLYKVEVSNTAGLVTSDTAVIAVSAGTPPVITRQPASATSSPGGAVTFSVEATGSGTLSYQWLKNGVQISGAGSASYQIALVQSSDAGSYGVRVSNSAGSVGSQTASLTVAVLAPRIVTQPQSQSLMMGDRLTLTVEAGGGAPLNYRWLKDGSYVSAASTSPDFLIPSIQVSQGGNYTVEVSNGTGTVVSQPAIVTVVGAPVIVTQPANQSVEVGARLTLSVEATGSGTLNYRWIRNGDYVTAASTSGSSYSVASVTSGDSGTYKVEVSSSAGLVTSQSAVVTVNAGTVPVITRQPVSVTSSPGGAVTFSVEATGSGTLSYQWLKNGVQISGAGSASYQIASVQSSDAGGYSVRVSNSVGSVGSQTASLTVAVLAPRIVTQPQSQSLMMGDRLTLTVEAGGGAPLNYRWLKDGSYVSAASTSPDFLIPSIQVSQGGNYTVEVSNGTGTVVSQPAIVTVVGAPVIVTQPANQSVEVGARLTLSVEATGSGTLNYRWIRNGDYVTAASTSGSSYSVASVTSGDSGTYKVEVSNSAGLVTSQSAVVTVNAGTVPVITRQPVSVTSSPGGAVTFSVEANGSGTLSYQWLRNGVQISGAGSSSYQIASVQSSDVGSYSVRVSNSAGSVTSQAATLAVSVLAPRIVTQPQSQSVTAGDTLTLTVEAGGGTPLSYRWLKDGSYVSAASGSPDFSITSIQVIQAGIYTAEVSNSTGTIVSQPAVVTVVGVPAIVAQPTSQTVELGAMLTLNVEAIGSGTLYYRWIRNGSYITAPSSSGSSYSVAAVTSEDAGSYKVEVSNNAGLITSQSAVVTVNAGTSPVITRQPVSVTTSPGGGVTFSVEASGSGTLSYQWLKSGLAISGAGSAIYQIASVQSSDASSYSVRVWNSAGSVTSQSATLVVAVLAPRILTQPQSQSVNAGDTLTLTVEAGGGTPLSYRWLKDGSYVSAANSDPGFSIVGLQVSEAGSYTVEVSNSSGTVASQPAGITVLGAPVIVSKPVGQSVEVGGKLTLSVEATGSGLLTYRWIRNGSYITAASSTGSSYTVSAVTSGDAGSYTVEVSNSAGLVTSQPAVVTVSAGTAPVITRQPVAVTTSPGGAVVFSVEADGTGTLNYQWLKNNLSISEAGTPSYQLASVQASDAGRYSVRVWNSAGSVTSQAATLTVSVLAPRIVTQPQSQSVIAGDALTLTVEAGGGAPLSYRWLKDGSYVSAPGTSPDFAITSIQVNQAGNYTVEVSNSSGAITSQPAVVTVEGAPTIVRQPASQSLEVGTTLTLNVEATGAGTLSYRWIRDGSYLAAASTSGSTYSIASVTSADAGSYKVEVSNRAGLVTSQSAVVTVTVRAPVITRQPVSASISRGGTATFSVEASGTGTLSYQWLKNSAAIGGGSSAFFQIASVQDSDAGSYSVRISNTGGSVTSQAAMLAVSGGAPQIAGPPRVITQPASQSVMLGEVLTLTVEADGEAPLSYRWIRNGSIVSTASSSPDFSIAAIQLSEAGNYSVEISNSKGVITSEPAVVTVVGAPVIVSQPASQSLVAGATLTLNVQATGAGTLTYRWIQNGSYITAASSSGSTYRVASVASKDAGPYRVEVSNSAGQVTSDAAVITVSTVNPPVTTVPVINRQPASTSATVGDAVMFSVEASGGGTLIYQWMKNGTALNGAGSASYLIASAQTTDAGSYNVRVSNSAGSVTSQAATLTVSSGGSQPGAAPRIVKQPEGQSMAVGSRLTLTVQATGEAPLSYRWVRNGSYVTEASNSPDFSIPSIQVSQAGSYSVVAWNGIGAVVSESAAVTVVGAPAIVTQPASQSLAAGSTLTLSVQATGAGPLTYRWIRNGSYITAPSSSGSNYSVLAVTSNDAGSYFVEVSNSAGSATSDAAVITVISGNPPATNLPSITRQPVSTSTSPGNTVMFSVEASGGGALSYQWMKNGLALPGAGNASYLIASVQSTDAGSYSVRVSNSAGSVTSYAATLTISGNQIGGKPQIVTQPESQSVTLGSTLLLTVEVTGQEPLSYRWVRNGSVVSEISNNPDFSIPSIHVSQAGNYTVEVSNAIGTVVSQPAVVTVVGAPTITTQPQGQAVELGATLTLSVQATGAGTLNYRWIRNGSYLAGATNATYSVASFSNMAAGMYAVEVSNNAGSVLSQAAIVTVSFAGTAPVINRQPASVSVGVGSTAIFSVEATGSGTLSYQWLKNGVQINGAGSASYQIFSAQSGDAGRYSVRVSNSTGSVTSQAAPLTISGGQPQMDNAPQIVAQPQSQSVSLGNTLILSVQASGGAPLIYRWVRNGSYVSEPSNNPDFSIASIQMSQAGNYTVEVSNSLGKITSQTAVVTVVGAPAIVTQPLSQAVELGGALTLNVQATGAGTLSYRWICNGSYIVGATNATYSVALFSNADAGLYTVQVSNGAGSVSSQSALVTVSSVAPVINRQPTSASASPGTAVTFSVEASGSRALSYQWLKNGSAISGAGGSSYRIASVQNSDAGNYTVRVSNNAGSVTSQAANLVVSVLAPRILTQPQSTNVIPGGPLTLTVVAGGGTPLSYRWLKNGSYVSSASSSPDFLIAATQATHAGAYTVEVSNSTGKVTSDAAVVTLVGTPVIVTQPASQSLAIGATLNLSVQATGAGTLNYRWLRNGSYIQGATNATYSVASFSNAAAGLYVVEVSNHAGTVSSEAAAVTVSLGTAVPVITRHPASVSDTIGGSATFSIAATGSGTLSYQWLKNGLAISGATNASYQIAPLQSIDAGSYSVRVSNSAGSVTSQSAALTVSGPPQNGDKPQIVVQPQSQAAELGATLTLSVEATGPGTLSYRWLRNGSPIPGATRATYSVASFSNAAAGLYVAEVSNNAGSVSSEAATVTVSFGPAAPVINQQPVSIAASLGETVTFSAQASGTGTLSYQWLKDGLAISGARSNTYQLASVQGGDAGNYSLRVSNSGGSVTSDAATLTVLVGAPPVILTQPASQSVAAGAKLALSVQATGAGPLRYRWARNNAFITGATNAIYTVASFSNAAVGLYTVEVSNSAGSVSSQLAVVTLTSVSPSTQPSLSISTQKSGLSTADGVEITVSARPGTYEIQQCTDFGSGSWQPLTRVTIVGSNSRSIVVDKLPHAFFRAIVVQP